MAFAEIYRRQVALLIRVLPLVTEQSCFALKGGTAINLFVRDLPRLSVDIDLTYLPVASHSESHAVMRRIAARIKENVPEAQIAETKVEDTVVRLTVSANGVQIKIEVTPVLRGCVFEPAMNQSCRRSKRILASRKPASSRSPISMPARSLPRLTGSIRATSSMFATF